MSRASFLDRDGVINRKPLAGDYITGWEQVEFLPGAAEAIALLNRAGFRVIVVTNQRCVAKGLLTLAELHALHDRMRAELQMRGAQIDAIYSCPHELHEGCACRKPQPGMLLAAAREHNIALHDSWMIGDSSIDIEAGKRAGCRTARLLDEAADAGDAHVIARSLSDAVRQILDLEARAVAIR